MSVRAGLEINEPLLCERNDRSAHVLVVRLNRPAQRNAMSAALVASLQALFDAGFEQDVRAIVLTGTGQGFCAGSDLADLAVMSSNERMVFEAASGRLARTMSAFPLPIVAAVSGFAIGGGLTLAAACDYVVTAKSAVWWLSEVPVGLFPAWGLEAVTQRIGTSAARRLAWGLERLTGCEAVKSGLADKIADDPLETALDYARQLATLPAGQAAAIKGYFASPHSPEEGDQYANDLFIAACATPEAASTFRKFNKRMSPVCRPKQEGC